MKKQIKIRCGTCNGTNIEWTEEVTSSGIHPMMVCLDCEKNNKPSLQEFLNDMGRRLAKGMEADLTEGEEG